MRLNLCGSSGTGKTTLAKALSEKLNLPLINSFTRKIPVEQRLKYAGQCCVFTEYLAKFQSMQSYVCDRSLYDAVAYSVLWKAWEPELANSLLDMISQPMFTPDLLIYTPIEFPMEPDKERPIPEEMRVGCDKVLQAMLQKYYHGKLLIVTGSVEARVNQVLGKLRITAYI